VAHARDRSRAAARDRALILSTNHRFSFTETMQSVRLEVRTTGEPCEECVGVAKMSGACLEVTTEGKPVESWELAGQREPFERTRLLDFQWTGGVEELARAGSLAFSHGHVLSIAVPPLE
jgi:hypothetical protein